MAVVELEVARQRRKERYITHRSNLEDWSVVERPRVVVYARSARWSIEFEKSN